MIPLDSSNDGVRSASSLSAPTRNRKLLGALLALFCFLWLAGVVWARNGFAWDAPAIQALHEYETPARDRFMVWVTNAGDLRTVIILAMLIALGLVAKRYYKDAHFLARCIIGTVVLAFLAKALFHRARPHLWVSPAPETDFGFPSGHTMQSLALAFAVAEISWQTRWRIPALLIGFLYALSVGLSRLYLGVHYPSDVLGGWALAFAWLMTLSALRGSMEWQRVPDKMP